MSFLHSIKFRFTLWYLAILTVLLVILASGVYLTLSGTLYSNLDESLKLRAEQLSRYRDIMTIVSGGTFEEEIGELISFYFYYDDRLITIAPRNITIPVTKKQIESAISGDSSFTTTETEKDGKLRIYTVAYTPNKPYVRTGRFLKPKVTQRRIEVRAATLAVARTTRDIEIALARLIQILLIAIPVTIVLSGGVGVFLARSLFKPVEQITLTAREIEKSNDLNRRIEVAQEMNWAD